MNNTDTAAAHTLRPEIAVYVLTTEVKPTRRSLRGATQYDCSSCANAAKAPGQRVAEVRPQGAIRTWR